MIIVRKFEIKDAEDASNLIRKALIQVNSRYEDPPTIQYLCERFNPKLLIERSTI